jgi:hypothetical protein
VGDYLVGPNQIIFSQADAQADPHRLYLVPEDGSSAAVPVSQDGFGANYGNVWVPN